jgi:hypothetical protein
VQQGARIAAVHRGGAGVSLREWGKAAQSRRRVESDDLEQGQLV